MSIGICVWLSVLLALLILVGGDGMSECMITTIDNPIDPFEDPKAWWEEDHELGRDTWGYLMRVAHVSDNFSDKENEDNIEAAIDEIIKYDFQNIYRKVYRNSENKK